MRYLKPIRGLGSFFFSSIFAESSPIAKYRLSMSCLRSSDRSFMASRFSSCSCFSRSTLALSSFSSKETDEAASKYSRTRTNARMMAMLACIAVSLRNTEDSIATPCSVNTKGLYLTFDPLPVFSKVTNCDLEESNRFLVSSRVNSNMKSGGNRAIFLLTACLSVRVSTWYNLARSKSSITFFPRISWIRS